MLQVFQGYSPYVCQRMAFSNHTEDPFLKHFVLPQNLAPHIIPLGAAEGKHTQCGLSCDQFLDRLVQRINERIDDESRTQRRVLIDQSRKQMREGRNHCDHLLLTGRHAPDLFCTSLQLRKSPLHAVIVQLSGGRKGQLSLLSVEQLYSQFVLQFHNRLAQRRL